MIRWTRFWAVVGMFMVGGCAGGPYSQGKRLLEQGDYAGAAQALGQISTDEPDNIGVRTDLAQALYRLGRYDAAMVQVTEIERLEPDNASAVLMRGLIHERQGDLVGAIKAYRGYTQISRLDRKRRLIQARLGRLVRERIRQDTRTALEREAAIDMAAIPDSAIAVSSFNNLGSNAALDPLRTGLAAMMITDLSKVPGLAVVERIRMREMMREIGLGQTGVVDQDTAPRLGKLLGVAKVVNGSLTDLAEGQVRLDISVAAVKTGDADASEVSGALANLFRLQKELTFGIVEEMGIRLTEAQRDAIHEIPTENLLAFIAYSKGLEFEDRGNYAEATAAFEEALRLDPGFDTVQEGIARIEGVATDFSGLEAVEAGVFEDAYADGGQAKASDEGNTVGAGAAFGGAGTLERLVVTGAYAGAGFIPVDGGGGEADVREPVEEQGEVDFGAGGGQDTVPVEVVVPLPQDGRIEVTGRFEE